MAQWQNIKDRLPMEEVKQFANALNQLGIEHNAPMVETYGRNLAGHVDNFDITMMQRFVDEFPEMIQNIQTWKMDNAFTQ